MATCTKCGAKATCSYLGDLNAGTDCHDTFRHACLNAVCGHEQDFVSYSGDSGSDFPAGCIECGKSTGLDRTSSLPKDPVNQTCPLCGALVECLYIGDLGIVDHYFTWQHSCPGCEYTERFDEFSSNGYDDRKTERTGGLDGGCPGCSGFAKSKFARK